MRNDIDGHCEECCGEFNGNQTLWGIQERTSGGKNIFHYYCSEGCANKAVILKTHKGIREVTGASRF